MTHPTLILGGGIIGLTTAYNLQQRGVATTLIDADTILGGASSGNAGHLAAEYNYPVANLATLARLPAILLNPLGPLRIDWRYLPRLIPFGCRMIANMTPKRYRHIHHALYNLNRHSVAAWERLAACVPLQQYVHRDGILHVASSAKTAAGLADQAAHSDGWVKLVGDWIDRSKGADSDLEPLWSRPVLRDAVAAAHEAGARVAVHAFSHAVIDDLIEAGVDDIEHGSGIDADQAEEIARRSILVAPTLAQVALFGSFADQAGAKYPVYAATMRGMRAQLWEHFAMLADSGVALVCGVDSGGYQEHGSIINEAGPVGRGA